MVGIIPRDPSGHAGRLAQNMIVEKVSVCSKPGPLVRRARGGVVGVDVERDRRRDLAQAVSTTVAIPAVARPWPRSSGSTYTPWIWQALGVAQATSALNTTRPSSIRENDQPRPTSWLTRAR